MKTTAIITRIESQCLSIDLEADGRYITHFLTKEVKVSKCVNDYILIFWLANAYCQVLTVDEIITDETNDTSIIWEAPIGE